MGMLCDAVAQGLIQPWCGTSVRADQESQDTGKEAEKTLPAEKAKKVRGKSVEKSGSTLGPQLDAAAMQDVKKALEVSKHKHCLSTDTHTRELIWERHLRKALWVISDCN